MEPKGIQFNQRTRFWMDFFSEERKRDWGPSQLRGENPVIKARYLASEVLHWIVFRRRQLAIEAGAMNPLVTC